MRITVVPIEREPFGDDANTSVHKTESKHYTDFMCILYYIYIYYFIFTVLFTAFVVNEI
jgi:hypothetical protein